METTEKIVESYCRYVKQWFTIPNIKCKGQFEIDLLAVDTTKPNAIHRYHIECGVSISGSFSKLNTKEFSTERLKQRVQAAGQRRTLGFFKERKFDVPSVQEELAKYGFVSGNYSRVIVTWDATSEAHELAAAQKIELWEFPSLLLEIADAHRLHRKYFTDDTARTIQLFALAMKTKKPQGTLIDSGRYAGLDGSITNANSESILNPIQPPIVMEAKVRSKYEPLELYLCAQPPASKETTLGFRQIEEIIGNQLPESAFIYREWWANQSDIKNRPQARSWINAGFVVDAVHQESGNGWVRFKRHQPAQ